jgi:hypothetical protein
MAAKSKGLISFQVSLRGRGLSRLSKSAMQQLVERRLDGRELPADLDIRIQAWKHGRELNMDDDNPRAGNLRSLFRRFLHEGRISLALRESESTDRE